MSETSATLTTAECRNCEHVHLPDNRPNARSGLMTACPKCRSVRYDTFEAESLPSGLADENERVRRVLKSTDGLGESTVNRVEAGLPMLLYVVEASEEQLTQIDGIGSDTAERIADAVQ